MRQLMILVPVLWAVNAMSAECISVRENSIEKIRAEYGMTTVEWSGVVHNGCDASYDGTLTIRFLNSGGEVLHEALEVIILRNNASERTSKRITLPTDSYRALDDINVDIRERERPI